LHSVSLARTGLARKRMTTTINSISGLKRTRARVTVLDILEQEKSPVDVKKIVDGLGKRKVKADQATVYRIMDAFYKKGIVERLELGEGKFRYELSKRDHHHHLVCEKCGSIEDVRADAIEMLEKKLAKNTGFNIKRHCLEFYGECIKCQS